MLNIYASWTNIIILTSQFHILVKSLTRLHVKSAYPIWNWHRRKVIKVLETSSLLWGLNHRALTMLDSMITWPYRSIGFKTILDNTTSPWTAISCTLAMAGQRGEGAMGGLYLPPIAPPFPTLEFAKVGVAYILVCEGENIGCDILSMIKHHSLGSHDEGPRTA